MHFIVRIMVGLVTKFYFYSINHNDTYERDEVVN